STRLLVNQPRTPRLELVERRLNVLHTQGDVMQPGASFLEMPRDRRIGRRRFEKFQLRFANGNEGCPYTLRNDVLGLLDFETQRVAVKGERGGQIPHGDPDVVQDSSHIVRSSYASLKASAFNPARRSNSAAAEYGSVSRAAMRSTILASSPGRRISRSRYS